MLNNVVLIGRLTREPELRYLPTGNNTAVARFTLAVDRGLYGDKKTEAEKKNQPTADFINIVVWGKQAESCQNNLTKGRLVAIDGKIQTGSYEAKDGTRRYTTDIVADKVQFLEREEKKSNHEEQQDMLDDDNFYVVDNEDIPF